MRQRVLYFVFLNLCLAAFLFLPKLSHALTVGPVKLEFSVNRGDVVTGNLFLMNEGSEEKTFYPIFEKFTEQNGERQFLPGEPTDLADWFQATSSLTLAPKQQKLVPFTIRVPQDAPPGGHYAVIWWSTAPANKPGQPAQQVAIVTRTGILVYLRVAGEVHESGQVSLFDTGDSKRVYWGLPVSFVTVMQNIGNVHLKPHGEVTIKNILGGTTAVLNVNPYGVIVLPQSEKGFQIDKSWDSGWPFGPYIAELNLTYGDSNKVASASLWLFVFSWQMGIVLILGAILIFFVIPKGIGRYNRWVVKRATKS